MSQDLTRLRRSLREFTPARVSLARAGDSIATSEVLSLQLAHAQARDAVHQQVHWPAFAARLAAELPLQELPVLALRSQATDRAMYLRNPGRGRTLHPDSAALLEAGEYDLAIVIADGLSALAIERHAIPVLAYLLPGLRTRQWRLAPLTLVQHGRVAIADPIGAGLGARCSLVLIGERPGLTSPDSMGAYLTWGPVVGRTDADRNCLSNIRASGLAPEAAAARLLNLLDLARAMGRTGTFLKEGADGGRLESGPRQG